MFLYMLAFMLTSVVEQALYIEKACIANHGYSKEICDNLDLNDTIKKEVQVRLYNIDKTLVNNAYCYHVQVTVSNFHQWNNIASHVVPMILALFLGAWSDKRGRKLPLIAGLAGKLFFSIMVIVNATQGKKKN